MAAEEKKEIVEKVKQIISEQLGVDENEVTPSASFVDDLGADSLDQVELVMALEEHFGVEIPDEDAEKLRTVQDAIAYIDKHAKVSKYNSAGIRTARRSRVLWPRLSCYRGPSTPSVHLQANELTTLRMTRIVERARRSSPVRTRGVANHTTPVAKKRLHARRTNGSR